MNFSELGLIEPIVRAVAAQGYDTPTPIQAKAIPDAMTGRDLLGTAQTGTGKTCAFALPILHRLAGKGPEQNKHENKGKGKGHHGRGPRGRAPRALVLAPTRELASQIYDSFKTYGKFLPMDHAVVFGGVNQYRQVKALQGGVDVLIATPGRLLDLYNQGYINFREIETLVLDEADRMLDMGFINDINKVVDMLPAEHQTLFFSATVSKEIRSLAASMLHDPVKIETAPEATTIEAITQSVYMVQKQNKAHLLERLLSKEEVGRTLVFTKTKHGADKLTKILRKSSINADAIHGNKTQNARTKAMDGFKNGRTSVLVATDVASRGIDVDNITHVVNFDMPLDPETYVHRIGRTARAGASGVAVSFCDQGERGLLRSIERRARIRIDIANDIPFCPDAARAMRSHAEEDRYEQRPARDQRPAREPRNPYAPKPASSGKPKSRKDYPRDERTGESTSAGRSHKKKTRARAGKPGAGAGVYGKSTNRAGKAGTSSRSSSKSNATRGKKKTGYPKGNR